MEQIADDQENDGMPKSTARRYLTQAQLVAAVSPIVDLSTNTIGRYNRKLVDYSVIRLPFPESWTERDDVEAVGSQAGDLDAGDTSEEAPDGESDLRSRTPAAYRMRRSFEDDAGDADEDGGGTGDAGDVDGSSDSSGPDVEQSDGETAGSLAAADGGNTVPGPTTSVHCPQCGHDRAAYQLQQTRAADEAPTRLYTCTECAHRWREDD